MAATSRLAPRPQRPQRHQRAPTRINLTAVYETVEQGWIQARVLELPEVITAAPTADEAKEMLADAVSEWLLSHQRPLPEAESAPPEARTGRLDIVIEVT